LVLVFVNNFNGDERSIILVDSCIDVALGTLGVVQDGAAAFVPVPRSAFEPRPFKAAQPLFTSSVVAKLDDLTKVSRIKPPYEVSSARSAERVTPLPIMLEVIQNGFSFHLRPCNYAIVARVLDKRIGS
jgi:hypothetical protein